MCGGSGASMRRWRWRLPFPLLTDLGGLTVMQPLGVWNAHERGGIGWPAIVMFGPDDAEARRFRARDFVDRPATNDALFGRCGAWSCPRCRASRPGCQR
jgi:hypothetical protein